jgi:hypothetical protein
VLDKQCPWRPDLQTYHHRALPPRLGLEKLWKYFAKPLLAPGVTSLNVAQQGRKGWCPGPTVLMNRCRYYGVSGPTGSCPEGSC